jgi:hypothetical protein
MCNLTVWLLLVCRQGLGNRPPLPKRLLRTWGLPQVGASSPFFSYIFQCIVISRVTKKIFLLKPFRTFPVWQVFKNASYGDCRLPSTSGYCPPQKRCLAFPNWRRFWLLDCEKMQQLWRELSLPFARPETLLVFGFPKDAGHLR